jgi:hypothetical protein
MRPIAPRIKGSLHIHTQVLKTLCRYMGTITGIGDLDPGRWPNSHWRSLKVGWDESTAGERQRRVSLWEIEPLTTPYLICPPLPIRKRPRAPSRGQSGISGEKIFFYF